MSELSDLMEFDHPVIVYPDGAVSDDLDDVYAPESVIDTDEDGQILADHERAWIQGMREAGWEPLTGYTGQDGYNGPIMHPSEYVGGRLERDMLNEPGIYVAVTVEAVPGDEDTDPAGWAVLRRAAKHTDYPHHDGRLPDCVGCVEGPCTCDPETDAPCSSLVCVQDEDHGTATPPPSTVDVTDLSVCSDCIQIMANGEINDGTDRGEQCADGMVRVWGDDARHLVPGDEELGFSHSDCEGCGSPLGGDRHRAHLVKPKEVGE